MAARFEGKQVLGFIENITLLGSRKHSKNIPARIDTGATKSSIDIALARNLNLGPVIKSKIFKSAHGSWIRPVIKVSLILAGKRINAEFSLADRNHMKYSVLIGQNILNKGFFIDPAKV